MQRRSLLSIPRTLHATLSLAAIRSRGVTPLARALSVRAAGAALTQRRSVVGLRPFHATSSRRSEGGVIPFNLADIGEGITEVEVLKWFVEEGEEIKSFDKICEVRSDKATVDITSRYSGRVVKVCHEIGDMAPVGAPLIHINLDGGTSAELSTSISEATPGTPKQGDAPAAAPSSPAPTPAATPQPAAPASAPAPAAIGANGKIICIPSVRRLAKEKNIDLSLVPGTGKGGRITKEDVFRYLEGGAAPAPAATATPPAVTVLAEDYEVPLRGFRRPMVKTMTQQGVIAHFGFCEEIEMDSVVALRKRVKEANLAPGVKFSYLPVIIKALSLALREYPEINAKATPNMDALVVKASHNISIAMDTPAGLVVPNVKNVQDKSLIEVASELNRLIDAAREGNVPLEDLQGGTITISNIGAIGGTYASPVLMPGELAIVALGKFQTLPRFDQDGNVVPRTLMNVSWAADHRFVDGAQVANMTLRWKQLLENPEAMIMALK